MTDLTLKLKVLLDENISRRLLALLKQKHFDVVSVHSMNMCGSGNGSVLTAATLAGRILVTFDKDFLQKKPPHGGILILDIHPARDPFVLPMVEQFFSDPQVFTLNWRDKIVVLSNKGFKIL